MVGILPGFSVEQPFGHNLFAGCSWSRQVPETPDLTRKTPDSQGFWYYLLTTADNIAVVWGLPKLHTRVRFPSPAPDQITSTAQ
jgi:hypothetical protein